MASSVCWHVNYTERKTQLVFAPKVEKAMSDVQQESQFEDFLDQHLLPLCDIRHVSTENLKIFIMVQYFTCTCSVF